MYKPTPPTKPGFYPIVWPRANILLVAHIPDNFDPKLPVISTTTWGSVWSLDEMTRMGVLWGEQLNVEVPSGIKTPTVKSRATKEDRADTELDQTPAVEDSNLIAAPKKVVKRRKKKDISLDALL
jgi:hypothetical protein